MERSTISLMHFMLDAAIAQASRARTAKSEAMEAGEQEAFEALEGAEDAFDLAAEKVREALTRFGQ